MGSTIKRLESGRASSNSTVTGPISVLAPHLIVGPIQLYCLVTVRLCVDKLPLLLMPRFLIYETEITGGPISLSQFFREAGKDRAGHWRSGDAVRLVSSTWTSFCSILPRASKPYSFPWFSQCLLISWDWLHLCPWIFASPCVYG